MSASVEIRQVPTTAPWEWLKEARRLGWPHYGQAFLLLFIVYAISLGCFLLPVIGHAVAGFLGTYFGAAFLRISRGWEIGESSTTSRLFSAFEEPETFRKLLPVAGANAALSCLAIVPFLLPITAVGSWLSGIATALVLFSNLSPTNAFETAFGAILRNIPAAIFTIILGIGVGIFLGITLGIGFFVILPFFVTGTWVQYRRLFGEAPITSPIDFA